MDLVEFLRARLDEDEAAAKLCAEMFPPPWEVADRGWRVRIYASEVPEENFFSDDPNAMTERNPVAMEVEPDRHLDDPHWLSERVEHIARHDPARVLRDVDAKRRVMEDHRMHMQGWRPTCTRCYDGDDVFDEGSAFPCLTLRALALPYADHEDYDESWRP